MAECWMPIMRQDDGNVYSFMVDLAFRDEGLFPDATRPVLILIETAFERPGDKGMGDHEEMGQLDGVFDEALGAMSASGACFVARARYEGKAQFVMYGSASAAAALAPVITSAFGTRKFTVEQRDDPTWSAYATMLPTALEERSMQDLMVVEQLRGAGDPLTVKRDVCHWAYFPDEQTARRFAAAVEKDGFKTEVNESPEPKPGQMWGVKASRDDAVAYPGITDITGMLVERAAAHGGEYDGWEAEVVRVKKKGLLSKLFKR